MKAIITMNMRFSIVLIALLFLSACSDSSQVEPQAEKTGASSEQQSADSPSVSNLQQSIDTNSDPIRQEVEAALAKQRSELTSQFNANTSALTDQMSAVKKQYDSLKNSLPPEVLSAVKEQIPNLETSIKKLKDMVAQFSPETISELEAFKTKYEKEYKVAQDLLSKLSTLMQQSDIALPKVF